VRAWGFLALLFAARALAAQQTPYDRAFELERRGSYAQAADGYRKILVTKPAELNALLGLERVLHELGKPTELAPAATAAVNADPKNPVLYGVAVRAWSAAGQPDSVRRIVDRWPRSSRAKALSRVGLRRRHGDHERAAYRLGRSSSGSPKRSPVSWRNSPRTKATIPRPSLNGSRPCA
jgi:tetratricopeptide (TPR) repeat protein